MYEKTRGCAGGWGEVSSGRERKQSGGCVGGIEQKAITSDRGRERKKREKRGFAFELESSFLLERRGNEEGRATRQFLSRDEGGRGRYGEFELT